MGGIIISQLGSHCLRLLILAIAEQLSHPFASLCESYPWQLEISGRSTGPHNRRSPSFVSPSLDGTMSL